MGYRSKVVGGMENKIRPGVGRLFTVMRGGGMIFVHVMTPSPTNIKWYVPKQSIFIISSLTITVQLEL